MTEQTSMTSDLDKALEQRAKEEKFKELANYRMQKTVTRLRQMHNFSNRATYSYTDEQAAKLVSILRAEVDDLERELNRSPKSKPSLPTL